MLKPIRMSENGVPTTGFVPSNLVAKEDFTTSDHTEIISEFFSSEKEEISAGVWECAPCREVFDAYPVHEMMTVIAGSVTLTCQDGTSETFAAGSTFFMPKGAPCTWEVTQTLRKFYMIAL